MKIQTFYGEYSLEHWIRLMKEGNILLPEYQRSFKWGTNKIIELIKSFREDQFIPPVIIAREGDKNFVLDGQQRLTSLLLVDLKKYPKLETWKYDSENDDFNDSNKFSDLTTDPLEKDNKEQFLKNKFLGFSFITLNLSPDEQKKALAKIFYSINTQAAPLTNDDKINAYKTIYPDSQKFIENRFFSDKFQTQGTYANVFIRTLGYVLQYKLNGGVIAQLESIENIAQVIESICVEKTVNIVNKRGKNISVEEINFFEVLLESKRYEDILTGEEKFSNLLVAINEELNKLSGKSTREPYKFNSITYFDMVFFGFLYVYLFEENVQSVENIVNKRVTLSEMLKKMGEISQSLNNKQPNSPKNLKVRMSKSVEIYQAYIIKAHTQALQGENNVNP